MFFFGFISRGGDDGKNILKNVASASTTTGCVES